MRQRPSSPDRLRRLRPALECRGRLLRAVRDWFDRQQFLEVETPVRLPAPALELHIDAEPAGTWYLRTSPELHMKRLLAAGYPRVYQVGPCFRRGERGDRHHPEYTMLEWYRAGADYRAILDDTRDLLCHVAHAVPGGGDLCYQGRRIDLDAPWAIVTVRDAFRRWAGWDPVAAFDADRFEGDLVGKVEPNLSGDRPVVLIDYPASAAALARLAPGDRSVAERWELYIGGLELANAYSELTDPVEQRRRFEECAARRRAQGKPVYPVDEQFLAALENGMPPAGGIALGIDRLAMIFADVANLDDLLPFRMDAYDQPG